MIPHTTQLQHCMCAIIAAPARFIYTTIPSFEMGNLFTQPQQPNKLSLAIPGNLNQLSDRLLTACLIFGKQLDTTTILVDDAMVRPPQTPANQRWGWGFTQTQPRMSQMD
ncbi:hypothetical protein FOXYSP1_12691 [Fusarium oxysporum f. sp. phaseoli]